MKPSLRLGGRKRNPKKETTIVYNLMNIFWFIMLFRGLELEKYVISIFPLFMIGIDIWLLYRIMSAEIEIDSDGNQWVTI